MTLCRAPAQHQPRPARSAARIRFGFGRAVSAAKRWGQSGDPLPRVAPTFLPLMKCLSAARRVIITMLRGRRVGLRFCYRSLGFVWLDGARLSGSAFSLSAAAVLGDSRSLCRRQAVARARRIPSPCRRVTFACVSDWRGRAVALRNALRGVLVPRPFTVPSKVHLMGKRPYQRLWGYQSKPAQRESDL